MRLLSSGLRNISDLEKNKMKKVSLAAQSGHLIKGGSMPTGRAPIPGRRRRLRSRVDESHAALLEQAAPAHDVAIPGDANVPAFLQALIRERFRAESNAIPDFAVQSPATSPSSTAMHAFPHSPVASIANPAESPDVFRLPRWKRMIDLTLLGCTIWAWLPLTLLVVGLLKIVSPGPAFYRQRRVGFRGKLFTIFKFRSMHVNAETRTHEEYVEHLMQVDLPMTKLDSSDPRLITGGRFLRTTGLDELPQIFNVLRGEMSLVGPRPCTELEFDRYLPEQRSRVNAPPGITGFWQVNGKNKTTFNEMIAMDIFYANEMSPALDLAIIWKTIPALLRQTSESFSARSVRTKIRKTDLAKSNFEGSPSHL